MNTLETSHQKSVFMLTLNRAVLIALILFAAFLISDLLCSWLQNRGGIPFDLLVPQKKLFTKSALLIALQMLFLYKSGVYRSLLRYFMLRDVVVVVVRFFAAAIFGLVISNMNYFAEFLPPARILFLDAFVAIGGICFVRTLTRLVWERKNSAATSNFPQKKVAIFGAGDAGSALVSMLKLRPNMRKTPVVFFDDDLSKRGTLIGGVPVVGAFENVQFLRERYKFDELVIAIPAGKITRVRELRKIAVENGLKVLVVPGIEELSSGKLSISALREFDLEDLLDRAPLDLNDKKITEMIHGKVALVTGAGGSIGSEICRQIAARTPARLILVEQCEVLMFQIEQELISLGFRNFIVPEIADILDDGRMDEIFKKFRPDIVFHAAAHKHVPLMERQPAEALKNNSFGSLKIFEKSMKFEAEACVMISTDKAINPTNAMGASKRLAEILMQSISQTAGTKTRFMAVRFGNVLGSNGSVIPTFKKQIAEGGPLTVTSPEIQRYFMTIPEAVGLVLQTGTIGKNGSIYVLNMGKPVKIIDVARHLIELSGLVPEVDIEIKITGLRPGEKLFEELKSSGEDFEASGHPLIARFKTEPLPLEKLSSFVEEISAAAQFSDCNETKKAIQKLVPEYSPCFD